jgi:hypothetical protein
MKILLLLISRHLILESALGVLLRLARAFAKAKTGFSRS